MLGPKGSVQISFHIYNPVCSAFLTLEILAGKAQPAGKCQPLSTCTILKMQSENWNKAVEWLKWSEPFRESNNYTVL